MSSFLALKLFKLKPSWLPWFWADFGFPLTFKCPLIRTSCSYAMVAGRRLSWNPHGEIVKGTCSTIGDFLVHVHAAKMTQGTVLVRLETWDKVVCCFTEPLSKSRTLGMSMWVLEEGHCKTWGTTWWWAWNDWDNIWDNLMISKLIINVACETSEFRSGSEFPFNPETTRPARWNRCGSEPRAALTGEDSGGCWALRFLKPEVLSWKRGKNGGNFCTWSCFSFSCRSTVKSWQLFADYFCWTLCCIILLDCRASLFGDDSDDDLFSSKK